MTSLSVASMLDAVGGTDGGEAAAPRPSTTSPSMPASSASADPAGLAGEAPGVFPVSQVWPGTPLWPPAAVLGSQFWPSLAVADTTTTTATVVVPIGPVAGPEPADPDVVAAVQAQVGVTEAAYEAAVRRPEDRSLLAGIEAATVAGSSARIEFVGAYEAIVAAGQRSVPDPEIPNSIELVVAPFIDSDGLSAVVVVCHVTGDSVVSATGETVSDRRNAWLVLQEFRNVDEEWKLFERQALDVTPEGTACESSISDTDSAPSSPPSSAP